jgi:Na(+)-translocating NADH:ubiquinone oxidoreductase C subunit
MKKAVFTIVFMTGITVFFIFVLAGVNELSNERIARYQTIERIQSILYACNIFPEGVHEVDLSPNAKTTDIRWNEERLLTMMKDRMKRVHLFIAPAYKQLLRNSYLALQDTAEIYIFLDENKQISGFGFPLRGKGLWGTIDAFAVISTDLTTMIGIDFTGQSETPGLGARITESWFKYLFRGLDLKRFLTQDTNNQEIRMVSKKEKSNVEESTNSVQAITGATQTCNGVLHMVNTDLLFYITLIRANQEILKFVK